MRNHRMITNAITDSDTFLEMSLSAQALYFHLVLHADDDGFVNNPKRLIRSIGCNEDDLKLLIIKGFVICFDSGIIVITHWHLHNSIRKDRKKETIFKTEFAQLSLEDGVYLHTDNQLTTECLSSDNQTTTKCLTTDNQLSAQDKISKDKISKENIIYSVSTCVDSADPFDYLTIINLFNLICKSFPKVIKLSDKRRKQILKAKKLLGDITFEEVFKIAENSDFLSGRSGKWNGCGFDWILNPTNLTKIIEGNYNNKPEAIPATINYEEEF